MSIKVSVIVTVYNNNKMYLNRCLHSLVNQTLDEIEIILVNDNSTDGSINILKQLTICKLRVIQVSLRGFFVAHKILLFIKIKGICFRQLDSYISRMFRKQVGLSIMEYVKERRLIKASEEIGNGRKIIDVALEYGYESYSTLIILNCLKYCSNLLLIIYEPNAFIKP
jgi:glycosyltransferase involved in cell wall biosynthesis